LHQRASKAGLKDRCESGLIFLSSKFFEVGLPQGVRELGLRRGPYRAYRTILRKGAFLFVRETHIDTDLPLDRFKHFEQGYVPGLFGKGKTALHAPVGTYDLGFDELLKDLGQKASGDFVFFRNFGDKADLFERLAGQIQDAAYPVISLSSDLHDINYSKPVILVKLNNIIVNRRAFDPGTLYSFDIFCATIENLRRLSCDIVYGNKFKLSRPPRPQDRATRSVLLPDHRPLGDIRWV
jgi:hypothetical protein